MTDSLDPRTGPTPNDDSPEAHAATDPDAMTFFQDEPASNVATGGPGIEGDVGGTRASGDHLPPPNAGYTGGLGEGNQGAAGMRQVVVDEATDARREGRDEETPSNLAQQDQ